LGIVEKVSNDLNPALKGANIEKSMTEITVGNCWFCGKGLTLSYYGRGDTCPQCKRDTKVCKGCEFYDPKMNNECRETQADRVVEKERSNFCDYFRPKSGTANGMSQQDNAKSAADALFKKK
jgi:hypothetical protein